MWGAAAFLGVLLGKNPPGTETINRGKLLQHKLIHVQCTKKSTRVPVSPVLGDSKFRFLFAPFHRGDSKFRFLFAPFHHGGFKKFSSAVPPV